MNNFYLQDWVNTVLIVQFYQQSRNIELVLQRNLTMVNGNSNFLQQLQWIIIVEIQQFLNNYGEIVSELLFCTVIKRAIHFFQLLWQFTKTKMVMVIEQIQVFVSRINTGKSIRFILAPLISWAFPPVQHSLLQSDICDPIIADYMFWCCTDDFFP